MKRNRGIKIETQLQPRSGLNINIECHYWTSSWFCRCCMFLPTGCTRNYWLRRFSIRIDFFRKSKIISIIYYQKQNNQIYFTYSVKPVYSLCLTKWHLFNLNSKTNYHVTISYFSFNKCYYYFFLGYQHIHIPGKYNPKSFKCSGCVGSYRFFRKCLCWLLI